MWIVCLCASGWYALNMAKTKSYLVCFNMWKWHMVWVNQMHVTDLLPIWYFMNQRVGPHVNTRYSILELYCTSKYLFECSVFSGHDVHIQCEASAQTLLSDLAQSSPHFQNEMARMCRPFMETEHLISLPPLHCHITSFHLISSPFLSSRVL